MIELLQELSRTLAGQTPDARQLAEQLGHIQSGGEPNIPFKVQPTDEMVKEIRVVHDAATGTPSQVILIPVTPLPMQQFINAFGEYRELEMQPDPDAPPRVSFHPNIPNAQNRIAVIASYDDADNADPDHSIVTKVVVIRN